MDPALYEELYDWVANVSGYVRQLHCLQLCVRMCEEKLQRVRRMPPPCWRLQAVQEEQVQLSVLPKRGSTAQAPLLKVGRVCRDEGAGQFCMRGTHATRDIAVRVSPSISNAPRECSVPPTCQLRPDFYSLLQCPAALTAATMQRAHNAGQH